MSEQMSKWPSTLRVDFIVFQPTVMGPELRAFGPVGTDEPVEAGEKWLRSAQPLKQLWDRASYRNTKRDRKKVAIVILYR